VTPARRLSPGLLRGDDGKVRCWWCGSAPDYVEYHDREWGVPVIDDVRLFEKISLEGFQAGLSWLTILRKRESFRRAFRGFEPTLVATFGAADVRRLLGDAGIVRHRGKIEAVISNAKRCLELQASEGSLAAFVWSFAPPPRDRPRRIIRSAIPPQTEASRRLSQELKRRGWRFVGPTTVYAFFEAMGLVNDHLEGCHRRAPVEKLRRTAAPQARRDAPR
jgi:DNA-3-methyladenine glycosylase I